MKRRVKKLTLSKETLHRLEASRLQHAAGGVLTDQESICYCWTDLCVSDRYTGCVECES